VISNRSDEQSARPLRPWWHFFVLTFALSWLAWLPGFLVSKGIFVSSSLFIGISESGKWLGGIGPSAASIILVARDSGWKGVRKLLGRAFHFRLGRWYVPMFVIVPAAVVFAHILNKLSGASIPSSGALSNPVMIPVLFAVFLVLQAGEEYGWRGYGLQRLQDSRSALSSSLILGGIWVLWHVPMFFIEGFGLNSSQVPFGQYAVTLICASILITWLQNNVGGSLVPAFVIHALINLSGEVLPLHTSDGLETGPGAWTYANILLVVWAIVVIRVWGPRTMVRR
jgi:CAAX protease family protein